MTTAELGNQHGYQCPTCGKGDELNIRATISVAAHLYADGTTDDGGDVEWDELSTAWCNGCDWSGLVRDLVTIELDD